MIECLNCKSSDFEKFFDEEIPCAHCDEINEIEYVVCTSCGFVAKTCNGVILNGVMFTEGDGFDNVNLEEMIRSFDEANDALSNLELKPSLMSDLVHRCLRCNTVSYEKELGLYHCPDCGFEWEIITGV